MSSISESDKIKALKISAAISEYFKNTKSSMARSTDLFDYLSNKKLIEWDRHQGVQLRSFLRKLYNAKALDLIPQCKPINGNGYYMEWHFINVPSHTGNRNLRPIGDSNLRPELDQDEIKKLISKFPTRNVQALLPSEKAVRIKYKRAYDYWTNDEVKLLLLVSESISD